MSLPVCFKTISLETNARLLLFTPSHFSFVHGLQHRRKVFLSLLSFRGLPFFIADFLQCS